MFVAYTRLFPWKERGGRVCPASAIDDRHMRVIPAARQVLLRHSHSPIPLACKFRLDIRQNSTLVMPEQDPQHPPTIEVPPGFTLHSENTTHILLPSDNGAFLNPVQEFNRDLSVACIRVWSEEWNRAKETRWKAAQEKKAKRPEKRLKGVYDHCVPCNAAGVVLTCFAVDSEKPAGPAEAKEKEACSITPSLCWTYLLTCRTVSRAEVRITGSTISYRAQVDPLR